MGGLILSKEPILAGRNAQERDRIRESVRDIMRQRQSVNRIALSIEIGATNSRQYRIAFQAARRDLEVEAQPIFFMPKGDEVWERCGQRTALNQGKRGVLASKRRLLREANKFESVHRTASDEVLREEAGRQAIQTQVFNAFVGEIARKRNLT